MGLFLLYIIFILLALIVISFTFMPIFQKKDSQETKHSSEQEFYKAQLKDLERDKKNNVINDEDAEEKRVEIAKRLLSCDGISKTDPSHSSQKKAYSQAISLSLITLSFTFLLYLFLGNPKLEGQAYADRISNPDNPQAMALMVQQVEDRIRLAPDDGKAWEVLAPIYSRTNQLQKASFAWQKTIELLGATPERVTAYAQFDIQAREGFVTDEVYEQLKTIEKNGSQYPQIIYFLAMAEGQRNQEQNALTRLTELAQSAPDNAPWLSHVKSLIENIQTQAETSLNNPTQEEIIAIQGLAAEDQKTMINTMVDGLENRLFNEGGSEAEWQRLIRSLKVLKAQDRLEIALERAEILFADNPDFIKTLQNIAQ